MIPLGYEIGTGRRVDIPLGHLVVTGQTQKSGKTTTLEALITRSGLRAVAFITKRGEKSFRLMRPIPSYFQERADWQFVQALLEAATKEKQDFKQAWIMRACEGAETLEEVHANVRRYLTGEYEDVTTGRGKKAKTKREWKLRPARGMSGDMYFILDKYFEEVIPQVRRLKGSKTFELARGVNVMDLSGFTFPMQALVIRSVLEYIYEREHGVIVIIPEAWEFIPEGRRSPVRLAAEELIRKGAAEKNYVWLDSQDIAGVAKVLLRQMEVWIFGVQRDPRELKRTLDALPDLPRPSGSEIALLGKGQFIVAYGTELRKVYVQPAGMEEAHAQAIALGHERPESWTQIVRILDAESERSRPRNGNLGERLAGDLASGRSDRSNGNSDQNQKTETGRALDETLEDEAMWKEKFETLNEQHETLKAEHATLIEAHDQMAAEIKRLREESARLNQALLSQAEIPSQVSPIPSGENGAEAAEPQTPAASAAASNGKPDLDAIYSYVLARAASQREPVLLNLLLERPELRVTRKLVEIQADAATLRGFLASLIAEKFFDAPKNGNQAFEEAKRRGRRTAKPNVYRDLDSLAELGFLTKEVSGYQAVPGMKVHIQEEK
jgi:hypothetical protein